MCQGFMFLRKKECCASYLLSKKMQDKFGKKKNVEIYLLVKEKKVVGRKNH